MNSQVLMEIDGVPIADDGTISFRDDERIGAEYIISTPLLSIMHGNNLTEGQAWSIQGMHVNSRFYDKAKYWSLRPFFRYIHLGLNFHEFI